MLNPALALAISVPCMGIALAFSPQTASSFGSSGADGVLMLAPGEVRVIDLATDGFWMPSDWLVRFDYSMVVLGDGATLTFKNHPSRAPVAWFVMSDVMIGIGATIRLDGQPGVVAGGYAEPGPGGYRGGRGTLAGFLDNSSAGLGSGGAMGDPGSMFYGGTGGSHRVQGALGKFATVIARGPITGSEALVQLAGGNGGGAGRRSSAGQAISGGGGGGGALWIAADGLIDLAGVIEARGGVGATGLDGGAAGGGGSGGAVHLASLTGVSLGPVSMIDVSGGAGGAGIGPSVRDVLLGGNGAAGRIRIDSPGALVTGSLPANATVGIADPTSSLHPPRLHVVSIGTRTVPRDSVLRGGLGGAGGAPDLAFHHNAPLDVVVATENIRAGSEIWMRVTRATGPATRYGPLILAASGGSVTFFAIPITKGISAVQAQAVLVQP